MGGQVKVDNLADAIIQELTDYSQEVTDNLKEEIRDTAKITRDKIKRSSPKLTGDYKKGWNVKKLYEGKEDIRLAIHNKKEYPLTHLLENGHAKRGGGRTRAYPHIKTAEAEAEKRLENRARVIARG